MTPTRRDDLGGASDPSWPAGETGLAARLRGADWSRTALGPIASWPESLRGAVDVLIDAGAPTALAWGSELSILFNEAWRRAFGEPADALGAAAEAQARQPWSSLAPSLRAVLADRARAQAEAGGAVCRLAPVFGEGGETAGVLVRTDAEPAPDDAGWLRLVFEFGEFAVWDRDVAAGTVQGTDALWRLLGEPSGTGRASWQLWASRVHPDDRPAVEAALRQSLETGASFDSQHRVVRRDGEIRWCRSRGMVLTGPDGTPARMLGIVEDETESRLAQERQRILLAELQHRVRNTLAVIRSIMRRTAETSGDVEHFRFHLEGRIDALARVQTLLARDPDKGLDLEALLREEIRAAVAERSCAVIEGPRVELAAKAAETLSLMFHELMTNAVKYGAVGANGGEIEVRWSVENDGPVPDLQLDWRESGLRGLTPPTHRGFGLELLERTLPYDFRARTSVEFAPSGFSCRVSLPLTQRIRGQAPDAR